MTPNKQEYKEAVKKVEKYEKRQKELKMLNKRLGEHLEDFNDFKFKVDRVNKSVFFAGNLITAKAKIEYNEAVMNDYITKLVISDSKAKLNNKFEEVIGKLICVLKAKGVDYKWIYKFVEEDNLYNKSYITLDTPILYSHLQKIKK